MFYQTHRLCPECDARVPASAVECPDCRAKLTPVRRLDTVRITLALTCVLVLAGGSYWALNTNALGGSDPSIISPRDWFRPDSVGLAIDSAIESGVGDDARSDTVFLLAGGRTEGCEPYNPRGRGTGPDARSGPVAMSNQGDHGILITIYRPDGQGWSTMRRRLSPGRAAFLATADGKRVIARSNWGVQVDQYCVEPFSQVAGWTGEHFTITWAGGSSEKN